MFSPQRTKLLINAHMYSPYSAFISHRSILSAISFVKILLSLRGPDIFEQLFIRQCIDSVYFIGWHCVRSCAAICHSGGSIWPLK